MLRVGESLMKRLDFTYSMLITLVISAVGTYYTTQYYNEKAKRAAAEKAKQALEKATAKKPEVPEPKQIKKLESKVLALQLSENIRQANIAVTKVSREDLQEKTFSKTFTHAEQTFKNIVKQVDDLAKQRDDLASELKVAHLNLQQKQTFLLAEIKHLHQLHLYLAKINEALTSAQQSSQALIDHLLKNNAKTPQVQKATYQLLLLERFANDLNRAIRFNLKLKQPELLIDRAKRTLAIFVTVVEGFRQGNATQGIDAITTPETKPLLTQLQQQVPVLESNLKPLIDSRLRIAKLRESYLEYIEASHKMLELLAK